MTCYLVHSGLPRERGLALLADLIERLAPGGIAGFAEPGPRCSRLLSCWFEMRTNGVAENDVDVHDIWRAARSCGLREMKLAVAPRRFGCRCRTTRTFSPAGRPPNAGSRRHASFQETRGRSFSSRKESSTPIAAGPMVLPTKFTRSLASVAAIEGGGGVGGALLVDALVTNSGTTTWREAPLRRVVASCQFNVHVEPVDPPRTIAPDPVSGELPPLGAGRYISELDYVAARVSWFAPLGSHPARVAVEVVTH